MSPLPESNQRPTDYKLFLALLLSYSLVSYFYKNIGKKAINAQNRYPVFAAIITLCCTIVAKLLQSEFNRASQGRFKT